MLWSTGSNSHGQLGHGTREDTAIFTSTSYPAGRPQQLAFGGTHTLALSDDGSIYATGSNDKGQLGFPALAGQENVRLQFERLPLELLFEALGAAAQDSGWEVRGVAAAWETSYVHLGSKEDRRQSDFLLVMGGSDWDEWANAVGDDGQRRRVGRIDFLHLRQAPDERIRLRTVKAGPRHVVALLDFTSPSAPTGRTLLVGWGASRHGQLGLHEGSKPPRTVSRPSAISLPHSFDHSTIGDFAIGREHTVILLTPTDPSSLILLGSSKQGQLGLASSSSSWNILDLSHSLPISPATHIHATWSSTFLLSPTEFIGFGSNSHSQLARPSSDLRSSSSPLPILLPSTSSTNTRRLSAGSEHLLLLGDEEVLAWGWNEHGNLGTGTLQDVEVPRVVWSGEGAVEGEGRGTPSEAWAGCATSWIWAEERGK